MRKLSLIALVVGVMLAAGCTGDDPSGPGGPLADVTGFDISSTSTGTNVVLVWTAVTDGPDAIDGYKIYIREEIGSGTWTDVATIPAGTTTYTHAATYAGEYGIMAYEGDDTSANYALDNDMPNFISGSYTIWNNHAPATAHSGFIFGATSGQTCLAASGPDATNKDMYCYDGDIDEIPWLYAGDFGPYGDGHNTDFYEHASTFGYPMGNSWDNGAMAVGDVIFGELYDGYWVKIYVTALPHYEGGTDNAYGITFYYDFQPMQGLELFTTSSTP